MLFRSKAYTSAALGALKNANIITYDLFCKIKISVSYSDYQKIISELESLGFYCEETKYSDSVTLIGKVKKIDNALVTKNITEATSGRCSIEILEEKFDFIC